MAAERWVFTGNQDGRVWDILHNFVKICELRVGVCPSVSNASHDLKLSFASIDRSISRFVSRMLTVTLVFGVPNIAIFADNFQFAFWDSVKKIAVSTYL